MTEQRPVLAGRPLRVAHVVDDFSAANSGVTSALEQLAKSATQAGIESEVYHATRGEVRTPLKVHGCRRDPVLGRLGVSRELLKRLWLDTPWFDVIHVHGVWDLPQLMGLGVGRALSCPVVFTPHNMLGGWLWRRSLPKRVKKRGFFTAFAPVYRSASVVHALSPVEAEALQSFFPKTRIAVIPNGIDLQSSPTGTSDLPGHDFVYLGRLYEGKGLELLIDAFAQVASQVKARLVLAGTASVPGYETSLRTRVREAGIEARVDFPGRVDGEAKCKLLSAARAVFLPSFSEGVSMLALETFAAQTPLVATRTAGCPEIFEHGGLLVDPNAGSIADAMRQVNGWTDAERLC